MSDDPPVPLALILIIAFARLVVSPTLQSIVFSTRYGAVSGAC
jgi:hypothetical protein